MSNFPSVRPSLNLQFDSQPTPEDMTSHLASVGATFSRASIGTYTDANGIIQEATSGQARPNYSSAGVHEGLLIEESRTNLIEASEDFSASNWSLILGLGSASEPIVTVNQAIAPDGTASADKIVFDLGGGTTTSDESVIGQPLSLTTVSYSATIYLKGESGGESVLFRTVGGSYTELTLTTEWQRFELTETYVSGSRKFEFGLRGGIVGGLNDTATVYAWGAQIEEGSFPTSYIPTIPTFTSRASDGTYFDSNGVLQTASTDEERIDHKYIDGQWVEAGLLLEGQVDNEYIYSEDFSSATSLSRGVITTNTTTAPDGNTTADTLTDDNTGGNNAVYLGRTVTVSTSTDYTFSIFAKKNTLNYLAIGAINFTSVDAYSWFNLNDGTLGTAGSGISTAIEDVDNGWYRCSISFTSDASDTTGQIRLLLADTDTDTSVDLDGTSSVHIWGAQFEEGSQPTSYIATSGSTATRSADVYTTATKQRSADVCTITGTAFTDFYNQEEGTFFANIVDRISDDGRYYFIAWDGSTNNFVASRFISNVLTNGIRHSSTTYNVTATKPSGDFRTSLSYSNDGDVVGFLDGTEMTSSPNASGGLPSGIDELLIGYFTGASPLNGTMKKLIYFPRALTDNELIKLTQ